DGESPGEACRGPQGVVDHHLDRRIACAQRHAIDDPARRVRDRQHRGEVVEAQVGVDPDAWHEKYSRQRLQRPRSTSRRGRRQDGRMDRARARPGAQRRRTWQARHTRRLAAMRSGGAGRYDSGWFLSSQQQAVMKAIFGVLSLLIALAIVLSIAKKQLQAVGMVGGASSIATRSAEAAKQAAAVAADP